MGAVIHAVTASRSGASDLSDAMRLALQWLEMLKGRPCAVRILRTPLVSIAAIFARVDL